MPSCGVGSIGQSGDCTKCSAGTFESFVSNPNDDDGPWCEPCQGGFYQANPGQTSCIKIPCSAGQMWDGTVSEDGQCIPCPDTDWCPDGWQCEANHDGLGCASCVQHYYMLNNTCHECPTISVWILVVIGLFVTAVFGYFAYKMSGTLVEYAGLATMTITHYQILGIFMTLSWRLPHTFILATRYMQGLISLSFMGLFFSPACEFNYTYYTEWSVLSILPLAIVLLIRFLYMTDLVDFDSGFRTMNFAIVYMFGYSLKEAWTMWDCVPLGDGSYVLQADPSIECFDSSDGKWIGFATMALVLVIGYTMWGVFIYLRLYMSMRLLVVVQQRDDTNDLVS